MITEKLARNTLIVLPNGEWVRASECRFCVVRDGEIQPGDKTWPLSEVLGIEMAYDPDFDSRTERQKHNDEFGLDD